MMTSILRKFNNTPPDFLKTKLFNESTFYAAFIKDLSGCGAEAIIESPFITSKRLALLLPTLSKIKSKGVKIAVNTRDPYEQDNQISRTDAYKALASL